MAKNKKRLIDTLEFIDVQDAQETIEKANKKLERKVPALIVSGVATAATLLSFVISNTSVAGFLLTIALFGSIASYIVGGGFSIALKTAAKLAGIGWFICPFPIDIAVGLCTLMFAIWAFFFCPIVFVFLNLRQQKRNIEDAEAYLDLCDQMLRAGYNYGGCYAQTPAYVQAPAYAQAPVYAQAPAYAQAPVYAQAPAYAQAPVYAQAPAYAQAPVYAQTPVYAQAPEGTNPPVNRRPSPPPFVA